MRLTFADVRQSRIPQALGLCAADAPRLASFVNAATQRLLHAGGETGWWGSWFKMVFTVNSTDHTITAPREVARIINIAICESAVQINNQFYEYLYAGVGPKSYSGTTTCSGCCSPIAVFDRGVYPTCRDLSDPPKLLRAYASDVRDIGKRLLIKGLDDNYRVIRDTDNGLDVDGLFMTLSSPFTDSASQFTEIKGIIKDYTYGDVMLYEVDMNTGAQTLLATFMPNEPAPVYRRYYLDNLPDSCCCTGTTIQVDGLAKLDFVPISQDTDFLLLGNLEALKEECESIFYSEKDSMQAQQMSEYKHKKAIKLLQNELVHYLGRERPAINMPLWGTATLDRQSIGSLI